MWKNNISKNKLRKMVNDRIVDMICKHRGRTVFINKMGVPIKLKKAAKLMKTETRPQFIANLSYWMKNIKE